VAAPPSLAAAAAGDKQGSLKGASVTAAAAESGVGTAPGGKRVTAKGQGPRLQRRASLTSGATAMALGTQSASAAAPLSDSLCVQMSKVRTTS
jgi:hypothetical protein